MRGLRLFSVAFLLTTAGLSLGAEPTPTVRDAVTRGLKRLEQGSASYLTHRQCFSCHHQSLSLLPMAAAKRRGFTVSSEHVAKQVEFTLASFRTKHETLRKGQGIGGQAATVTYALFTLDAVGHVADETTAALVEYLLQRQKPDGSWTAQTDRPPTEGSPFTNAALALRVLRAYGPDEDDDSTQELRRRIDDALSRGLAWLRKATPRTTEDRVFHLRGLVYGGAKADEIGVAREALLKEQGEDGSWRQLPELAGDAYATGTVLVALRHAGLAADAPAYRKGVEYLLRTQQADGSWLVTTRSRPIQVFFDNGDPGGRSQFISFYATGWATLALLESLPVTR